MFAFIKKTGRSRPLFLLFSSFQYTVEFLLRPEMKPVVIGYNLRSQCMVSVLPETGLHHESYQQVNNLVAQRYPSIL